MVRQAHHPEQGRRTISNFQKIKCPKLLNFGDLDFGFI